MVVTMHRIIFSALAFSLLTITALQAEQVYKWRDENGNIVYSQHPPAEGVQYQTIKDVGTIDSDEEKEESNEATSDEEEAAEEKEETETGDTDSSDENAKVTGNSEEDIARRAALKAENCKQAKEALDAYTVHRRFKGEDGQVVTLTEEQRQANIRSAELAVQEFCN